MLAFDFETHDVQFRTSSAPVFREDWEENPLVYAWEFVFGDAYRNGLNTTALLFTFAREDNGTLQSGCITVADDSKGAIVGMLKGERLLVGANTAFDIGVLSTIAPGAPREIGGRCIDILVHVRFAMFAHALHQYVSNCNGKGVKDWLNDPTVSFMLSGANLKGLVASNLGVKMKKWAEVCDDEEALREYAIKDAEYTLGLFQHLLTSRQVVVERRMSRETYPLYMKKETGSNSIEALVKQVDWDAYYKTYPSLREFPPPTLLLYFGYASRQYFLSLSRK